MFNDKRGFLKKITEQYTQLERMRAVAIFNFLVMAVLVQLAFGQKGKPKGGKQISDGIAVDQSGGAVPDSNVPVPEDTTAVDLANLSNMLGKCTADPTVDVTSVFGGLFMSSVEADAVVLEAREQLKGNGGQKAAKNRVEKSRQTKLIGEISTFAANGTTDQTCCETRLEITAPGKVMVDGEQLTVVHMNHSYQYVQEGVCTSPGVSCRGIGICTQIYKYVFMLLYDPKLVTVVNPPVKYGRVNMRSHCECMNVGRILK